MYDVHWQSSAYLRTWSRPNRTSAQRTRVSDFFGASLQSQLGPGLVLGGSVTTGRTVKTTALLWIPATAGELSCRHAVQGQTLVKAHASYPFPHEYCGERCRPECAGISYTANYPATNAEIAPSLNRNLAACGTRVVCNATATVPLIPLQTMFDPRRTQIDLRVSKQFSIGSKMKLRADLDVYNVTNGSAILFTNYTYGPAWRQPVGSSVVGADLWMAG